MSDAILVLLMLWFAGQMYESATKHDWAQVFCEALGFASVWFLIERMAR